MINADLSDIMMVNDNSNINSNSNNNNNNVSNIQISKKTPAFQKGVINFYE